MKVLSAIKWFAVANITVAAMFYTATVVGLVDPISTIPADEPAALTPTETKVANSSSSEIVAALEQPSKSPKPQIPATVSTPSLEEMRLEIADISDRLNALFPTYRSFLNGGSEQVKSLGKICDAHIVYVNGSPVSDGSYRTVQMTANFGFSEIAAVSQVAYIGGDDDAFTLNIQISPDSSGMSQVRVTDDQQNPYDPRDQIIMFKKTKADAIKVRDLLLDLKQRCRLLNIREQAG